ncbi:MAG: hypothetical protein Q9170_003210 [Blastenia crenularia]
MSLIPQRLPQRASDHLHRGGDSWRPSVPQEDFTFRNGPSAPQFPQERDGYRPSNDRPRRNGTQYRNGPSHRGRGPRWATAARPLLSSKRGNSPEDMLAQTDPHNQAQRFLPADDVSDSDEEDMEESDLDEQSLSDGDQAIGHLPIPENPINDPSLSSIAENPEPPTKRRATATTTKDAKEAASAPKWSNPDPYTVLPPVDEAQRKRRDVVKIIRKARIVAEKGTAVANQVAANDDFISFGLGGDRDSESRPRSSSSPEPRAKEDLGVPGAPTGPRAFSHLNNLHSFDTNRAPGTFGDAGSAHDLGPPPGLTGGRQAEREQKVEQKDFYPDHEEALGNRKRTFNDDIKGDSVSKAGGKKAVASGSVLTEWIPRGNTDPTPWLAGNHRSTEHPGFRLHKEVCDFYEFVKPQRHEQTLREDLLQRLQGAVKNRLPDCDLYCFGSFAAGMYLPNADMDLVIISSSFRTSGARKACQTQGAMQSFAAHLERIGLASSGSLEVIHKAKVPIIKFIDQMTGIHVDISFENETGLVANETFSAWKHHYPAMPIITILIKQFLKMRGLDEVVNGGLGGFSVTCLVTSLLQNLPRVQSGEVDPEHNLGEMLLEFLDLYGNQFDLARTGISMNPPGYYDKQAATRFEYRQQVYQGNRGARLAIVDPNNRQNDISGGSKNVGRIFDLFSDAHEEILKAMGSPNRISLLDWALGGDYRSFTVQRQRLRDLYKARWSTTESGRLPMEIPQHDSNLSDSSSSGNMNQRESISLSGLSGSIFLNPLDPNVIVLPKPKVAKAKKKKPKHKGLAMAAPIAQKDTAKSMQKLQNRARKPKATFPSMDIPSTVSVQEQLMILENAEIAKLISASTTPHTLEGRRKKAIKKANAELSETIPQNREENKTKKRSRKSKMARHARGAHKASAPNVAKAARNTGTANDFPIVID